MGKSYKPITSMKEVPEQLRKLRRQYLRYQQAEIIYSISHKKLLELASDADEIDDEDLEFMSHDYVTYNMACEYYRLGIKPVVRMAHEAGAVYKIGKKVLIRRSLFEAYLREQRKI